MTRARRFRRSSLCLEASAIDGVDYSAAETLRSVHASLKAKGVRLVVAEVVKAASRYRFMEVLGEDAFYDSLDDVISQYRQQFKIANPSSL